MSQHEYQLVLSTCPDPETAERIARALVDERLAACVNILPIARSIYLWKGQIESAPEQLLIIKSVTKAYGRIQNRIRELHTYELPEIIAVPVVEGLPEYLAWIRHPEKS